MVLIINENFMNYLQVAGAVVSAKWNAVIGQLLHVRIFKIWTVTVTELVKVDRSSWHSISLFKQIVQGSSKNF